MESEGGPRKTHVQTHGTSSWGLPFGTKYNGDGGYSMVCGHEKEDPKGRNPHIKFHEVGLSCVDFKAHFQLSRGILSDHVFCRVTNKKNKFIPIPRIQNHHART